MANFGVGPPSAQEEPWLCAETPGLTEGQAHPAPLGLPPSSSPLRPGAPPTAPLGTQLLPSLTSDVTEACSYTPRAAPQQSRAALLSQGLPGPSASPPPPRSHPGPRVAGSEGLGTLGRRPRSGRPWLPAMRLSPRVHTHTSVTVSMPSLRSLRLLGTPSSWLPPLPIKALPGCWLSLASLPGCRYL